MLVPLLGRIEDPLEGTLVLKTGIYYGALDQVVCTNLTPADKLKIKNMSFFRSAGHVSRRDKVSS